MGREVRMVPPNWKHPKRYNDNNVYEPMFEKSYEIAMAEWINNHQKWLEGMHPDQLKEAGSKCKYFADWDGDAPNIADYNSYYKKEDATWYQLYETVSEGTPVSPPFETKEELAQYLAENGDFWYQECQTNGKGYHVTKPTLEQARGLVNDGFAMSGIMANGKMYDAYEQQDLKVKNEN